MKSRKRSAGGKENLSGPLLLDFPAWLNEISPDFNWGFAHVNYINAALQGLSEGLFKRLMIFLPPRHGKSEQVTIRYAAWRMEQNPELNLIVGSYNKLLANRFSRQTRKIVASRIELSKERRAAEEWESAAGGRYLSISVGSGVTGFGADLIIIDDPIRGRSVAESALYRESVWNWYQDDLRTRLNNHDGQIILIQTRWHEDDLAGRLLDAQKQGGDQWHVISLAAFAEKDDPLGRAEGGPLCPERFDKDTLEAIRGGMSAYSFSALYQQRPVPHEGGLFKRKWLKIIDRPPENLRWVRYYDLAASTRETGDFTASIAAAIDDEGNIYFRDLLHGRWEYPDARKRIIELIEGERSYRHGIESALHGLAFTQELLRDHSFTGTAIKSVRVDHDKITRAHAWSYRAEQGKVFLIKGDWNKVAMDEILQFPFGKHDDIVDAFSGAVIMLQEKGGKLIAF